MKFLLLNGSNLNMLGIREPAVYGQGTYEELLGYAAEFAGELGVEIECVQSNHEGDLVDAIQRAYFEGMDGIILNPGGYTHTSVAILDAVKAVALPTVEVHISKMEEREDFRQHSYVRSACVKTITGQGFAGYRQAAEFLVGHLQSK
jgi:3-dehydroquinate dehydratase-2